MKKVLYAGIGGRSFSINEDAYERLEAYLAEFRSRLREVSTGEVMDDLESRIAELFSVETGSGSRVVDMSMVEKVISQLGMPDGSSFSGSPGREADADRTPRRLYRDTDDVRIAGVCSGLALYFNVDVVLLRILFVILVIAGMSGLLIYLILWIVVPKADTPARKCELRGLAPTAGNMARFTTYKKK